MFNRINKVISLILCLVCLSAILFSFAGCEDDPPELHVFNFGTPEGFDSLLPEEKLEWAKDNEYLVISYIEGAENEFELYNENLLDSFLENKTEEKELLIMEYCKGDGDEFGDARFLGIYFDGKYYHTTRDCFETNDVTAFHYYKTCSIEYILGYKLLCVSNDSKLTAEDEWFSYSIGGEYRDKFQEKHYTVVTLMKE